MVHLLNITVMLQLQYLTTVLNKWLNKSNKRLGYHWGTTHQWHITLEVK